MTTTALSQTIRIATMGDIDQNSAKFSLSDRQVPIRVMLPESARATSATMENLPVPTTVGRLRAAQAGSPRSASARARRRSSATNQIRRLLVGADLAPGRGRRRRLGEDQRAADDEELAAGRFEMKLGDQKWQAELIYYFMIALLSGVLLVFAVLVLLYRRFLSPLVNMGSLLLAPLGAAIAAWPANRCRCRC